MENRVLMALVHSYDFNEPVLTDPADPASYNLVITDTLGTNDGTLVNYAVGTDPGVERLSARPSPAGGGYLNFDAIPVGANTDTFMNSGGRVDLTNSLTPDLGVNGTVAAYMRITPGGEVIGTNTLWRAPAIAGNEQAGGGNDIFFGSVGDTGTVAMAKGDGAAARSRPIADGTWHHVAVSRSNTGQQSVYIDGRLHSQVNGATGDVTSFFNSIGALVDVAADGTTIQGYNYLNNTDLDRVQVYNTALTQAEVNALLPGGGAGGTAPAAPTGGTATVDSANGSLITVAFTDPATNEAGFILERATSAGGPFTEVAGLGTSTATNGTVSFVDRVNAFNTQYFYRVRAFNPAGSSSNLAIGPVTSGATAPNSVSAGYLNSNFWGATNRVWPADNKEDGATPGAGAENVGALSLDDVNRDPSDPSGIAVRNPDITEVQTLTQFTVDDGTGTQIGTFRQDFDARGGSPIAGIRIDNFSTIYTGKIIIPDLDGDAVINTDTTALVRFIGNSDDDGHLYVNGVLVSTDPAGHGARDSTHIHPGLLLSEGQKVDFVMLQAEQGGGANVSVKYESDAVTRTNIPASNLEAGPSVPQASLLTLVGDPSAHQVSFEIGDSSTSEQRFELYRRETAVAGSPFVKVNEVGINSPFINDASARPGTAYEYQLRGFNFASGLGAPSNTIAVTTPADPAPAPGLQGFYFNDDFWGQGEVGPRPANNNVYVGFGDTINSADVHEFAPVSDNPGHTNTPVTDPAVGTRAITMDFGNDQHDPSVRPGGSPHVQIRDNSHSTVFTGQLVITEAGTYQILGFTDDDGYVVVDGTIVSSDPGGHGIRDPRINPNNAARFTVPITLTAGEHDLVVMHSEGGGGSGVILRWIRPGQTTPETIPEANLNTRTPAPTAATAGIAAPADARGTNALITLTKPAGATNSELKQVLEIATDAGFTQNYRKLILGVGTKSTRVFGLTPGTQYFTRVTALNFEGQSTALGQFNSSASVAPSAPTNLQLRSARPDQVTITFTDNSIDETGFVIERRNVTAGGTFAPITGSPIGPNTGANPAATGTVTLVDTDATLVAGNQYEYRVTAVNAAGASSPALTGTINAGGAGGTGLRRRIWDDISLVNNNDVPAQPNGEPTDGLAPIVDDVDPLVDDGYGEGAPAAGVGVDTFAIEWVGEIVAEETKGYDFSIVGDDGVRLFINDVLVIDGGWRLQGDTEYFSEPIALTAGQRIKVRMQMYENGGGATARLRWNGPGNVREAVPTTVMFPTVAADDVVAQIPIRPVTFTKVVALPGNVTAGTLPHIDLRWQDNAFGEGGNVGDVPAGYEIQRATDAAFTQGLTTLLAPKGTDLYVDNGGVDVDGNPTPLDPTQTYHYRIRPVGGTFVNMGSASISPAGLSSPDFTADFSNQRDLTLNNFASNTAEKTLKLTHNQNDRTSSAYFNRSFDINTDFKADFDIQIGNSNGADGMTFVIHNFTPATGDATQLRAIGGGGGALGYSNIGNSVAVKFDFYNNIDHIGVYTNGAVVNDLAEPNTTGPDSDPPNELIVHEPNVGVDVRPAGINLDGNTPYRVTVLYDENDAGTPDDETDDTGVMTIEMRLASAAVDSPALFTTKYNVNVAQTIGDNNAVMGFTGGTGGLNAKQEVLRFAYDGPAVSTAVVSEIYVRGSSWRGQDGNAATTTFMEYLEEKGLGDDVYGYRLFGTGRTAPAQNPEDIISWINVNQIVVRYTSPPTGTGVPTPGIVLDGQKSDYTVTAVTPVAGDPTAFVLTLDRPLGGGDGVAVAPPPSQNGDRITVNIAGGGAAGSNFSLRINVLQGDVSHVQETTHAVLANDYAEVKNRFFKTTRSPTGTAADYTAFHDVDGSGSILANDYSEVKKRFFQTLPAPTAAAAGEMFSSSRVAEEVL